MISPQRAAQPVVGIDVGKATCHVAIRFTHDPTDPPAHHFAAPRAAVAARILALLDSDNSRPVAPAIIAIERTGALELPIIAALEERHRVYIATNIDSKATRITLDIPRKTDLGDADLLSLMCLWKINPATAPSKKQLLVPWDAIKPTTGPRDHVRWHQALVRDQTRIKNRLTTETEPLHQRHLQAQLALIKEQVAEATDAILAAAGKEEALLATIPSISLRRACVITAAVGDVRRFPTPNHLVGYLAMKPPWRDQTGGKAVGTRHMPKGLALLHSELFMAALTVACIKRDCSLTRTHQRIKARSGGKVAILAVRRQIIRTAWGVLTSGEPYRDHPSPVPRQHRSPDSPRVHRPVTRTAVLPRTEPG